LLPAKGAFDGAEWATYDLSKSLLSAGMEVVIVTSSDLKDEFAGLHPISIYVLPEYGGNLLKRIRSYSKMIVYLHRLISIEMPDVVHVQGSLARLLMLAFRGNRTIVETLHGVGLAKGEAFRRLVSRTSITLAAISFDGFISVSQPIHNMMSRIGARSYYIPNSIDGAKFKFVPLENKDNLIIFVGRLTDVKKPQTLVEAINLIHPFIVQQGIQVRMIGEGPLREDLELEISRLGLESSIRLEGRLAHEEVREYMARAYAYVSCSSTEGMSLALLEAMASGCLVLASNIPGNSAVIQHEKTGLLFDSLDPTELAGVIQRAFQQPSASKVLASNARDNFESNYDSRLTALRVIEVYEAARREGKGKN
jgi:glycosyltransferase involved in cell wall biosynthesis